MCYRSPKAGNPDYEKLWNIAAGRYYPSIDGPVPRWLGDPLVVADDAHNRVKAKNKSGDKSIDSFVRCEIAGLVCYALPALVADGVTLEKCPIQKRPPPRVVSDACIADIRLHVFVPGVIVATECSFRRNFVCDAPSSTPTAGLQCRNEMAVPPHRTRVIVVPWVEEYGERQGSGGSHSLCETVGCQSTATSFAGKKVSIDAHDCGFQSELCAGRHETFAMFHSRFDLTNGGAMPDVVELTFQTLAMIPGSNNDWRVVECKSPLLKANSLVRK